MATGVARRVVGVAEDVVSQRGQAVVDVEPVLALEGVVAVFED